MFFGLVFYFWVDKYNLLRRSSIAENISGHVSLRMMKLLDITLMLKPAGELIFDRQIREKIQVESIVLTCIGFVYLFMPWDRILELAVDEKFFLESRKYSDIKNAFI